jgi:hypothetical protein
MLILKQNAANTVPTPPAGKGTIFLDDSDTLSVKTSDGNVENFPTVAASNAQVVFMNGTALSGEAAFTYDFNNNVLNITGNIAAGNVKTDNLLYANGNPWDLSDPGGSNTQIQFNDDESFGGSAAFTFDKSSNLVTVGANLNANNLNATTHITSGNVWANSGTISAQTLKGEGGNISNIQGANVSGTVGSATTAGTVTTAAQPNITSVGTLSSLAVTGNATAGNVYANSGTVGASLLTGTLTTAAQPNITSVGTLSALTVTGNVSAGNLSGTLLTGTLATAAQPNVTSVGTLTSLAVTGNISAGNVSATTFTGALTGAATTAGTVTTAAQPNITSVGTLSSLSVTGNANVGNIGATNGVFTNVSGNGSALSSLTGANVTGQVGNALVSGTVYTNAQPNITSVGTLSSLAVTGNITSGNANLGNLLIANVANLVDLNVTGNANIGNGSGGNISGANVITANTFVGNLQGRVANGTSNINIPSANGNINISAAGNANILIVTGTGINVAGTLNVTGNANIGNLGVAFVGATANVTAPTLISNIATGTAPLTVTSTTRVANLNVATSGVANTVNDAAQPNITSVGTLSSLSVTGNVSAGNVSGTLLTGTLATAAQPNVTSVGTLTVLGVNGNITAANITANTGVFTGNGSGLSQLAGGNVTGQVGNALVASTVYTNAQPNITSVGTLSSLAVTANVAAGNLTTTGVLSVTGTGVSSIAGNLDMTSNNIINLATPVAGTDAATKQYVDDLASTALVYHEGVIAATTGTLASATGGTITYNNGTAGVGATLTTTGTFNLIDTANVQTVGTRILVKNEANAAHNGVYTYTSTTVITRATDADSYGPGAGELSLNNYFFVSGGSVNKGSAYVLDAPTGTITFGTSNITFAQFSSSQVYLAGTGLTLSNLTFSVNASQTQVTALGTVTTGTWNSLVGSSATFAAGLSGANLASITGANVTGTVPAATVAGTVTTAAQPNITSVGTLTGLGVNGTVTAVAFTANTGVFTGNGSGLSAIAGANVTGTVGSATTAGTVTTAAQPNITSVGTLTSLAVTGNASAGNISTGGALSVTGNANVGNIGAAAGVFTSVSGNGSALSAIAGANVTGEVGFAAVANSVAAANISGQVANALVAGTVYTNAQPNITSVGTLSSLAVTGNATAGNVYANSGTIGASLLTGALTTASQPNITSVGTLDYLSVSNNITSNMSIYANSGTIGASLLTGTLTTAAQPNVTSLGTLTGLGANGNVTAVNITANTGVFTGNGSGLTALNASNISTGTLSQSRLANASLTVNGTSITLGGSGTITANTTQTLTLGSFLTGTSFNGGTAVTAAVDATSANTASKVVARDASGNFSAGTITATLSGAATTAGTVTTAAQPNITSVGTLTSLSVSGQLTNANLTTGANTTAGSLTGNWSLTAGSRLQATYADLAEKYVADAHYEVGTVLLFGGDHEVTMSNEFDSHRVAGVVSHNAAYVMNAGCQGEHVVDVALTGRVPVKVHGPIAKGDLMVTGPNGHAVANNMARAGTILGKALHNFAGGDGIIEIVVGRV